MAYGIQDQFSKASVFALTGETNIYGNSVVNYWYSPITIKSKAEPKGILVTNTGTTGITFNAYVHGPKLVGITNYIKFSENIRSGTCAGNGPDGTQFSNNIWLAYSSLVSGTQYSQIRMPDGSTNGTIVRIAPSVANGGVYQPIGVPASVMGFKRVYTASVWACGDSGGGVYPENPTFRISYFAGAAGGNSSIFSEEFTLSPTPKRYSFTFVSTNPETEVQENIAFACGSLSGGNRGYTAQFVLWGAQLCDGTTMNNYIPSNTNWNGFSSVGAAGICAGVASSDSYESVAVPMTAPPQSSYISNISPFTISTNNKTNAAPPAGLTVYGLY